MNRQQRWQVGKIIDKSKRKRFIVAEKKNYLKHSFFSSSDRPLLAHLAHLSLSLSLPTSFTRLFKTQTLVIIWASTFFLLSCWLLSIGNIILSFPTIILACPMGVDKIEVKVKRQKVYHLLLPVQPKDHQIHPFHGRIAMMCWIYIDIANSLLSYLWQSFHFTGCIETSYIPAYMLSYCPHLYSI